MLEIIEKLSRQKQFTLVSTGDSMLPVFRNDDFITYRRMAYSRLGEDDIVLVRKGGVLFTHRIIYKTSKYAVTKGDNNPHSDGKVYPHQIVAKAVEMRREGKTVNMEKLSAYQALFYFHEIAEITDSFRKAGIDMLILKGLPVHLYYESRRPKRIYFDCDILVDGKNRKKISAIMKKNGYRKFAIDLSPEHRRLNDKVSEDSYVKLFNDMPVVFDIHYEPVFMMTQIGKLEALYPQSYIDSMTRLFLRESREVLIEGKSFPFLSENHLIPYLMLHFFHHNFRGTYRLALMHHILLKQKKNKDLYRGMADFINSFRLQGYVCPGFLLLKKYYNTPLPASFLQSIQPSDSQNDYIRKYIIRTVPHEGETRIEGGIRRFKQLFYLSPGPLWKKGLVFFNPAVWYSVVWALVPKPRTP